MYVIGTPLLALINIINTLLFLYSLVVFVAVICTWFRPNPNLPIVKVLYMLTFPVFAKVRKYLPSLGGLDLSPLVVLLSIMFIQSGILPVLSRLVNDIFMG